MWIKYVQYNVVRTIVLGGTVSYNIIIYELSKSAPCVARARIQLSSIKTRPLISLSPTSIIISSSTYYIYIHDAMHIYILHIWYSVCECDFYFTIFHYIQPCVFVRENSPRPVCRDSLCVCKKIKLHTHYNNNYWTRKNAFSAANPGMRIQV